MSSMKPLTAICERLAEKATLNREKKLAARRLTYSTEKRSVKPNLQDKLRRQSMSQFIAEGFSRPKGAGVH